VSLVTKSIRPILIFFIVSFFFLQAPRVSAEEYYYGFGVVPSYTSGDYGTGDNVNILYLPLIFKYYPSDRVRATVVVPWVRQSSTQVVSAGGTFYRIRGRNIRSSATNSESGLGDIILRGEVDLLQEMGDTPALTVEGKVKLPTASESKGLGTGELDYGITFELGKTVDRNYFYGRLGYTVVGEPSGADFNNPFLYEAGVGLRLSPELSLNLSLEGRTAIDDQVDNPLEAVAGGTYRLRSDLSLNGYFLVGLSDGSPDYGLGVGFLQKF
jgi:hypothetical protein